MKTWPKLLAAILLTLPLQTAHSNNDVIVRKVGDSWMFVFPAPQGRFIGARNPAGVISIGQTITVAYALEIIGQGKARFIGVDAEGIPNLAVALKVQHSTKPYGFLVTDLRQPHLNISISPELKNKPIEEVARHGNLNLTLAPVEGGFKIVRMSLD